MIFDELLPSYIVIFLVLKSCDVEVVESDRSDCFLSCQS